MTYSTYYIQMNMYYIYTIPLYLYGQAGGSIPSYVHGWSIPPYIYVCMLEKSPLT